MRRSLLAAAVASLALTTPSLVQTDGANTMLRTDALPPTLTRDEVRTVAPALERYGQEILLGKLWRRPGLAPRDRSLVTVSALIAAGHIAQLPYHLNRAMDNGLTRAQAAAAVTHLAFYAGWPNAFSAVPAVKGVFEGRRG
jgi:4-carboxymuconolactone decarboxylase